MNIMHLDDYVSIIWTKETSRMTPLMIYRKPRCPVPPLRNSLDLGHYGRNWTSFLRYIKYTSSSLTLMSFDKFKPLGEPETVFTVLTMLNVATSNTKLLDCSLKLWNFFKYFWYLESKIKVVINKREEVLNIHGFS